MQVNHPFIARIRLERSVISMVNKYCSPVTVELRGLSLDAIQNWFSCFPQFMQNIKSLKEIREQLEYLGKFARVSSNGSHRGAMVAPPSRTEIAEKQMIILENALEQLVSKNWA